MSHYADLIRGGGSKGLPRAMHAFYESLLEAVPDPDAFLADYIQIAVLYPNALFVAGTPQYVSIAPWNGEIVHVGMVNQRLVTGGPSVVSFKVDGGTAFATLNTGAGTVGLAIGADVDPPAEIDKGGLLSAESDGNGLGVSEVLVFATLRFRNG